MIIDIQSHILNKEYIKYYAQHCNSPRVEITEESVFLQYDNMKLSYNWEKTSPGSVARMMEDNGIDLVFLSPGRPDCSSLPDKYLAEGTRICNNGIQEAIEQFPGKFKGVGYLPWLHTDEAIQETHRLKDLGFVGVMLCSHINKAPADLPELEPVYKELARLGLVLFLHPTDPEWSEFLLPSMVTMVGYVVTESFALLRMTLSGVLERNPDLKIIMPHCGGIIPMLSGRIRNQTDVMKKGMEYITITPMNQLTSGQVGYDLVSPDPKVMRFAAEVMGGTDKFMFATDYPWGNPKKLKECITKAFPDQKIQNQLLGGNAKRFFNL